MTDQEIVEACAKMMGWKKENNLYKKDGRWWQPDTGGGYVIRTSEDFQPLTDWNHWRQVEEKIMSDVVLWQRFMASDLWSNDAAPPLMQWYMQSGLRTRCLAALSVISPSMTTSQRV